jgi:hypothetical protein
MALRPVAPNAFGGVARGNQSLFPAMLGLYSHFLCPSPWLILLTLIGQF